MNKNIFLFPGQSSWHEAMFDELRLLDHRLTEDILQTAASILGFSIEPSREKNVGRNLAIQTSIFTANHIYLELLKNTGVKAQASAGLSLGEYSHLLHIGAISFEQGLLLVKKRGEIYEAAPPGAMAALYPITENELLPLIAELNERKKCIAISNYNSPSQFVVAGKRDAVDEIINLADEHYFCNGVVIEPYIAMHSFLFQPVSAQFRAVLNKVERSQPVIPYIPNVEGAPLTEVTPGTLSDCLARHVSEPVQWSKTIEHFYQEDPETRFIEVGPKTVVHDLLTPKWRRFKRYATASRTENTVSHFNEVVNELRY